MTDSQEVRALLGDLARSLAEELDGVAHVDRDESLEWCSAWTVIEPMRSGALGVVWTEWLSGEGEGALQIEAGHQGGRWELGADRADVDFIEEVTRAVIAGRVVEIFGPGRSRVEVTTSSGEIQHETGSMAPRGCLPVPGWVRRGRRVGYVPYREDGPAPTTDIARER